MAVALGGMEALVGAMREMLVARGRADVRAAAAPDAVRAGLRGSASARGHLVAGEAQRRMRPLPFATEIAPGNSLILAPHPDGESLGRGVR